MRYVHVARGSERENKQCADIILRLSAIQLDNYMKKVHFKVSSNNRENSNDRSRYILLEALEITYEIDK